jgi:hypothetical protein
MPSFRRHYTTAVNDAIRRTETSFPRGCCVRHDHAVNAKLDAEVYEVGKLAVIKVRRDLHQKRLRLSLPCASQNPVAVLQRT